MLFDADGDATEENGNKERHRKDNELILKLATLEEELVFPEEDKFYENLVMWKTNITETIKSEIEEWQKFETQAAAHFGNPGNLKKNSLAIGYALELAWKENKKSDSLQKLVEKIVTFAEESV